jgi:hypothetical protein
MEDKQRLHTLDIVRRVLEEIGSECNGVMVSVEEICIEDQILPVVFLKWNPQIHPKTKFDPAQCIVLNAIATGNPVKDDTLRKVLRETIERMIKVDKHANKITYNPDSLSVMEGRDVILRNLEKSN